MTFDLRVFISSTFTDLQACRQAAFEAIQSLGAHGDDMLYWSADERSGAQLSLDRVRRCDVLILLLAHRYGHVPPGAAQSVTELEYGAAREAGVPVLAYFVDDRQPWPPEQIEWEQVERLRAFKRRVEQEVTRSVFRTPDELARLVTQALALFADRHRERLAARRRHAGATLRVEGTGTLLTQPDTVVQIGHAEDGLPLLLRVQRSHDLSGPLDALATRVAAPGAAAPAALMSSFRQALEEHARAAWSRERIVPVHGLDAGPRELYVSSANLAQMFRSRLALLLAHAGAVTAAGAPRASGGPDAVSDVIARSVIRAADAPQRAGRGARAALQSEGGRNRFLGIDPGSGEVYSVGYDGQRCVAWRRFRFETLATAFPGASARLDGGAPLPLRRLGNALFERALHGGAADPSVAVRVSVSVPRQQVALLLAELASRLVALHETGRVHGDLKPDNILLTEAGPELIDDFGVSIGDVCPGWTPAWSAPEQILGEPVGVAADLYPFGRMIAALLGGELVGEVRKFKARPAGHAISEFDIFYNPSIHRSPRAPALSTPAAAAWVALARDCLRFVPAQRPATAALLRQRLLDLAAEHPLGGEIGLPMEGTLQVATLLDGSQAVARVLGCGPAAQSHPWPALRSSTFTPVPPLALAASITQTVP